MKQAADSFGHQDALRRLEAVVHPLVAEERKRWLNNLKVGGANSLAVLDIPLLFETRAEEQVWDVNASRDLS